MDEELKRVRIATRSTLKVWMAHMCEAPSHVGASVVLYACRIRGEHAQVVGLVHVHRA